MTTAAGPSLLLGPWTKVESVRRYDQRPDLHASIARSIAASHARKSEFQAVIGRPSLETGQCVWLYGGLLDAGQVSSGVGHAAVTAGRVRRLLETVDAWVSAAFELVPRRVDREERRSYGAADVIFAERMPAVWVVTARPVPESALDVRRAELSAEIGRLESQGAASRLSADRASELVELLDDRAPFGLWEVEVAVGSSTEANAASVLHGLSQMVGLGDGPVRLSAGATGWMGTSELASLVAPPAREVPGIRVVDVPEWDQALDAPGTHSPGSLVVGAVLAEDDTRTAMRFQAEQSTVNRHVFVCGATGSGKSETVRTILEQLAASRVPWLVIEPAKAEYHLMAERLVPGSLVVLRPGDLKYPPGGLNPLEPTSVTVDGKRRHFPLQTHIDLVRTLFTAAFDAEEPFPQVLSAALERSYRSLDWDLSLGRPGSPSQRQRPVYPSIAELRAHALAVVDEVGYGREIRDNVRGFIEVRIGSLEHGTPGRFFNDSHMLDLQKLATQHVVLQLEDIGNDRDQAFVLGAVLIRWIEMLRLIGARSELAHVIAIEEAHRLLRATDNSSAHSIEMLANLLAEVRAYGQGLIVAEQIPSKIIQDVVKNSALKVMHRLPAQDDRDFVGATMNLGEDQSRAVVAFAPGEAAIHADGMDRPVRVAVDMGGPTGSGGMGGVTSSGGLGQVELTPRVSCEVGCGPQPCDARQLAEARRLADRWELRLWIDLVVLAHLAGRDLPSLREAHRRWANAVVATPDRLVCGVNSLVDRSVRARWQDVVGRLDPEQLAAAAGSAAVEYLATGSWKEARGATRWQVGRFRWIDIEEALTVSEGAGRVDDPHPLTQRWQQREPDLEIPLAPVAEQLTAVRRQGLAEGRDGLKLVWGDPSVLRVPVFLQPRSALEAMGIVEAWVYRLFASGGGS